MLLLWRVGPRYNVISPASSTANTDQLDRDSVTVCDQVDSLAINNGPETTGVTEFVQEACSQIDVLGAHHVPAPLSGQSQFQDLKAYFSRPRLVTNGNVTSVGRIAAINVTPGILLATLFPDGVKRLTGVYGIRFTLVFTLQVAATPFHQGLLALNWQYEVSSNTNEAYVRSINSETSTNLPHVRLDLSVDTMVQLKVPFLWHYEFLPVQDTTAGVPYGLAALNVILPVPAVAGLALPTYKIFVHMDDMELLGADNQVATSIIPQGGKFVEKEVTGNKPSSVVAHVSDTVRFLARGIPAISSFTSPANWFLDGVAGSLKAFGYSKPLNLENIHRMQRRYDVGENNVDLPVGNQLLGPLSDNHLPVSTFCNTDVDEMSLKYILSQYNQICIGGVTPSEVHGTVIYGTNVSPSFFWFRSTSLPYGNWPAPLYSTATTNAFIPSNLFYIGQMFRLWRGGFRFRVTFAKTKHHGGRMMISYNPTYNDFLTSSNTGTPVSAPEISGGLVQPFGYTMICDLRDDNVFEFDVPYWCPAPYMAFDSHIGGLTITVMDPLQAPAVVNQGVGFLVEVKALPDFHFAVPRGPRYPPMVGNPAIRKQSGKMVSILKESDCQDCIGEKIESVKQLIMIPSRTATTGINPSTFATQVIPPWFAYRQPDTSVPFPNGFSRPFSMRYGSSIALMYTYATGSTDFGIVPVTPDTAPLLEVGYTPSDEGIGFAANNVQQKPANSILRQYARGDQGLFVRTPAYFKYKRVPVHYWVSGSNNFLIDGTRNNRFSSALHAQSRIVQPYVQITNGAVASYFRMYLSAGDDARLGLFIGPPPLHLTQSGYSADIDSDYPVVAS